MAADQRPPSFFHILINPSSPHLPLPPVFVTRHLRNDILEDPMIKSANGGYLWKLKMKKIDDQSYCLVDGWCNVVKDVGLSFGEFLLFRYVGSAVFLMHVYSVNGCEKILVPKTKFVDYGCIDDNDVDDDVKEEEDVVYDMDNDDMDDDDDEDEDDVEFDDDDDDDDMEEDDDVLYDVDDDDDVEDEDDVEFLYDGDEDDDDDNMDVDGDDGDPFFMLTSSKSNINKLRFPPDFVALARIDTRETITFKNDYGYEKEMTVQSDKKRKSSSYYVATGWKEFQRSNGISEGDKFVFKFITSEDKICLAKITKNKTPARPLTSAAEAPLMEVDADDVEDDDGMVDKNAEDDKDKYEDENVELIEEDPFFAVIITPTHSRVLRMPADFVRSAGIGSKRTLRVRSLDGKEMAMPVQFDTRYGDHAKRYFLLKGWKDFMQCINISEGDKCVFKFITSEDKLCLEKITKPQPAAEALATEVNDDDDKDESVDVEPVDDVDPFFVATITASHKYRLSMPTDFVGLAGIDTKENIVMLSLDGNEFQMDVRKNTHKLSTLYYLYRWTAFRRSNNISQGDKCVFKYITSEDKMCLVKITKASGTEVDGMGVVDDNVTLVDETDPFFKVTISPSRKLLLLPTDFVALAGIGTKENIIIKGLDGKETQIALQSYNIKWLTRYCFSLGWTAFKRSNNISDGDECVFKYIKSEDKMCLEKITKKITRPTLARAKVHNDDMDDKDGKGEDAKLVDDDDVNDNEEDDYGVDGDPSFIVTISKASQHKLRFSPDFVALTGIDTRETITLRNDDGYEKNMPVQSDKKSKSNSYYVAAGWKAFQRSNDISEGDKCVFKFITSEDKMCLAKIVKALEKEVDVDYEDPSFVVTITTMNKAMLRLPSEFVALAKIDTKENIIIKSLDGVERQMAIQSYKQFRCLIQYHFSVGWPAFRRSNNISEGDECVFKYIRGEDKFCLVKVTKRKTRARSSAVVAPEKVDTDDDGSVGKGLEDDKDEDEDEDVELVDDGDPFFVAPIFPYELYLPADIVRSAGIDTKKTLTILGLDGYEMEMPMRCSKHSGGYKQYYVAKGWPEFRRNNDILEGDKCVFKFITSDDKLCLAKINKKKTPTSPLPRATNDDAKDENEDVERVDDEDPFFVATISLKFMLRLPSDFVALAKIDAKKNIIVKSLDGTERQMAIQSYKHYRCLIQYHFSVGWLAFRRSNNISEGDECVFKYIRGEDKLCLVKVTTRKTRARSLASAVVAPEKVDTDDDGINGKGLEDDKHEDEDEDVELVDDGDPFFVAPIFPRELQLPVHFVRSAGIDTKKTLTLLGLNGYEMEMPMRCSTRSGGYKRYYVAKGWPEFRRNNDILEGDKCVFKFITSDDKLCLAKIHKKKTPTSPLPPATNDDAKDENEDVERVDDEDHFFVVTISHKFMLWLPSDFVALAKVDTKENIIIKSLDGNERQMAIRTYKHYHWVRYHFSIGWPAFRRSNNISQGDECVFKYIRSEDKMCLVKVTKRKTQAMSSPPAAVARETEVDADDAEDDDRLGANDKDEEEDADLVVDDDPFFVTTITQHSLNKCFLRMPVDFVRSAGIDTKKTIRLKSLDGYEKELHVRYESHYHYAAKQYFLGRGWMDFTRNTNISAGDKCLFKFITCEDKLCLAKITKAQPTQFDDDDVEVDRCMHDKDADKNVELADGVDGADPFFEVTITTIHKSMLRLPSAFVGLSGIDAKENIIIKSVDGNERLMALRSYQQNNSTHHCLWMGWPAFMRSNSISEGDECVFKYITSEDKMCLAKVTNTKTQTRLSSPAKVVKRKRGRPAKVVKRKRGRPAKITMTENVRITVEEVVKRKRGRPAASPRARENVKRKKGLEPHGHSGDVEGVDSGFDVGKRPRGRPAKRLCGKAPQQIDHWTKSGGNFFNQCVLDVK